MCWSARPAEPPSRYGSSTDARGLRTGATRPQPTGFAKPADLSVGRLPITWSLLGPDLPGTIGIRYKTGFTKWWCGIQVIGHRNPVAALEVRDAGGLRQPTGVQFARH